MTYRVIEFGTGVCPVCDQVVPWGKRRARGMPVLLGHGPRGDRCPGGGHPGKPWLEATRLPKWEAMSDLDKGAALMHVWKRKREGGIYARENYPCEYIEDPVLLGLPRNVACHHATAVCGRNNNVQDRLGIEEWDRLYNLALDEGRRILDSRKLWAVRYESGGVLHCDTEDYARRCATDLNAVELLRRTEVGGAWTLVEDLLGVFTQAKESLVPAALMAAGVWNDLVVTADAVAKAVGDQYPDPAATPSNPVTGPPPAPKPPADLLCCCDGVEHPYGDGPECGRGRWS